MNEVTAMFDLVGVKGELIKADKMQRLTMANLCAFFAKIVATRDIIESSLEHAKELKKDSYF